jgi:hypothetical protein
MKQFIIFLIILFLTGCSNFNRLKKDPLFMVPTVLVVMSTVTGIVFILYDNKDKM